MKTHMNWLAAALFALSASFAATACGDDDDGNTAHPDAHVITDIDAATADAGAIDAPTGADADCITDPTTNDELLNACTSATVTKIPKHPTLPLLNPDGTLPPLP
jgi:hypothetical protein